MPQYCSPNIGVISFEILNSASGTDNKNIDCLNNNKIIHVSNSNKNNDENSYNDKSNDKNIDINLHDIPRKKQSVTTYDGQIVILDIHEPHLIALKSNSEILLAAYKCPRVNKDIQLKG